MKTRGRFFHWRVGKLLLLFTAAFLPGSNPARALTLLVYNSNSSGAGSLRQAIQDNAALGGGNVVTFSNSVTGEIVLSGQIVLTANITIEGPGAHILTLSGNSANRLFTVTNGVTASITGLTLARGYNTDAAGGAGFLNFGTLNISDCVLTNNTSSKLGGALMNLGTARLSRCMITKSSSPGGTGLYNQNGFAVLTGCTFSQNTSGGGNGAGVFSNGTLNATNCTFFGNGAGEGGGVFIGAGSAYVINCTVYGNTAGPASGGGGLKITGGSMLIRNTIVAGNTTGGLAPDVYGVFTSGGYNFIGKTNGAGGFGALGDQLGTTNSPLNPLLGGLASNGGPTPTMPPLAGSPLIDQAKSTGVATDQRGRLRPYDHPAIPNAVSGDGCDIGAVEVSPSLLVVTNLDDNGPGSLRYSVQNAGPVDGDTVIFAQGLAGTIALTNGPVVISRPMTIIGPGSHVLSVSGTDRSTVFECLDGTIAISGLTICDGRVTGSAGAFEQNGSHARGGGIFNQATLALSACVISNCTAVGGQGGPTDTGFAGGGGNGLGGGLANLGILNATNCTFISNEAIGGVGGQAGSGGSDAQGGQSYGGGIYSFGTATLVGCAVVRNNAMAGSGNGGTGSGSGGGIYNELTFAILSSTVSSNKAAGSSFDFGGGIFDNGSTFLIRNCTITGNQAGYGGGLSSFAADMGNTIVAGNTAGSGSDVTGGVRSSDYNLIQNTTDITIDGEVSHNIYGTNPNLSALGNYGGPTPSHTLLAGSPALDKGYNFGLSTDQRGAPRPFDFPGVGNAAGGDATDIGAVEAGIPILLMERAGTEVVLSWPGHYGDFTLQSSGSVQAPAWNPVATAPVLQGSRLSVTNSATAPSQFFRLQHL